MFQLDIKLFKQNYLSYFLGIIIPGIINFSLIPLLKSGLEKEIFSTYSFYLSAFLLVNSSVTGMISQSVIRLHINEVQAGNKSFYLNSIFITFFITLIFLFPFSVFFFGKILFSPLAIIFYVTMFVANVYITLMSIAQANFSANLVAFSEIARSVLFISFAVLFAGFYETSVDVETLFSFQLISYTVSMLIILFFVPRKIFDKTSFGQKQLIQQLGKIMSYGGYLFIWFFTSYLIANGNRFVLSSYWGKSSIGEFTAVFDMISKSIVMLLSPVLLSIFPIAVKAFESGQFDSVNKTISRIIRIELLVMFFIVICYYLFGYQILTNLLKIEQGRYRDTGAMIVIATFIWQISMVKHKILELTMKIGTMVKFIVISLVVTFSLDLYFCRLGDSYAVIGFLFGAMTYYGLCHRYCTDIFSSNSKVNC